MSRNLHISLTNVFRKGVVIVRGRTKLKTVCCYVNKIRTNGTQRTDENQSHVENDVKGIRVAECSTRFYTWEEVRFRTGQVKPTRKNLVRKPLRLSIVKESTVISPVKTFGRRYFTV